MNKARGAGIHGTFPRSLLLKGTGSIGITWQPIRNAKSWPHTRPPKSESVGIGSAVCRAREVSQLGDLPPVLVRGL